MTKSKIEWTDYSWNPITGCKKECTYCINRRSSRRFTGDRRLNLKSVKCRKEGEMYILDEPFESSGGGYLNYPFGFEPTYHRYRLDTLDRFKSTQNILVCGDGEMFGTWVPDEYIKAIMTSIKAHPKNHYIFLTQYPERYEDLARKGILLKQDNCWYGWTYIEDRTACWDAKGEYHTFVNIEPLNQRIVAIPTMVEWIIIGADTGYVSGRLLPQKEWVKEIIIIADQKGIPVYLSDSLKGFAEAPLRKDIPLIFKERYMSDKLENKMYGVCMKCNQRNLKRDMYTLMARKQRGQQPKQYGFMCCKCFKEMQLEYGFEMPDFDKKG